MVSPDDLLQYAKYLRSSASKDISAEVQVRCCAGRGYYAIFHKLRPLADMCPEPEHPRKGSHESVIQRLTEYPYGSQPRKTVKEIRRIGVRLAQLRDIRNTVDYDIDEPVCEKEVDMVIHYASRLFTACDEVHDALAGVKSA